MKDDILDYFDEFEDRFEPDVRVVAIRYFSYESNARIYAARLKESGIPVFLSNANTTTVIPLGEGGIGLHVKEEDAFEAQQILRKVDVNLQQAKSEFSYRDADEEDIAFERALNEPPKNYHTLIISTFVILLILLLIFQLIL